MYLRIVKVPSSKGTVNEYVRIVEAYRDQGKVKQRVIADLGRKDVLTHLLPQLQRLLRGEPHVPDLGSADVQLGDALTWGPVLVIRALFDHLGLWALLDDRLGQAKTVPFADRVFVLVANRLIRPTSEHGLARWLETGFVCDRQGRRFLPHWQRRGRVQVHHQQLDAWYRTLDQRLAVKKDLEVRLYQRLRDLFSLQPDLVLYDLTSTYFEGAGPTALAKHGYSRDGKAQNVQIVVGLVLVNGWPIAHHVWAGNRTDASTVQEIVKDLQERFTFRRVIFVGDRGMVTEDNLAALTREGHGYLVGVKRRRNVALDGWLQGLDESKWLDCPMGITAREKKLRTRVQEVASGNEQRVFVIDSEERRAYEQAQREKAMTRVRQRLEKLQRRVATGKLTVPEQIGAAAERALQKHHGSRYYAWELRAGQFTFQEHPVQLPREKRLEGKYVLVTGERELSATDAVARYKELMEVEQGFRHLKDVLALRPIYHQVEARVKAHVLVAALALLVRTLLARQLKQARVEFSAEEALQAVATIRHVTFEVRGERRSGVSAASPRARQVLKAVGIEQLRPPTPPAGEETVM